MRRSEDNPKEEGRRGREDAGRGEGKGKGDGKRGGEREGGRDGQRVC